MAAVPITIDPAVVTDANGQTLMSGKIVGMASITGLGIGGGPIIPPDKPDPPNVIWPGPGPLPPLPGGGEHPSHPIALPGDPWWPTNPPPTIPPPGSPPVVVGGDQVVNPITPPPAIIVDYPGVGKVLVPLPTPPPA
jgi:hypothetical protein